MTFVPNDSDQRLNAANLTLDRFLGDVVINGDPLPGDDYLETLTKVIWERLPEHALLRPIDGYSLRGAVPNSSHAAYLIYNQAVVGLFLERDVLLVHSVHQGQGLGQELVLLAFAQKPWRSLEGRKVSNAGHKTLQRAHELAQTIQHKS